MDKKKLLGTIIGVIAFIALIAGATYAWFTWASSNSVLNGTSGCFTITYDKGTDITGSLTMSSGYAGGRTLTVSVGIAAGCTVTGNTTIYLHTNDTTSAALLADGALKYAVSKGGATPLPAHTGAIQTASYVEGTTDIAIVTADALPAAGTSTNYTVYIWLDGSIADNAYSAYSYSGYIHARADQAQL